MTVQVSDKHKCIFVHVPKAAGSSIETSEIFEDQRVKTREYVGGHTTALEYREKYPNKFDKYYKFAFVRNPYSRLVSAFFHLINSYPDKKIYEKYFGVLEENFDIFCERSFSEEKFKNIIHLKPQYEFICDENYNIIVDFVGKQENYRSDAKKVFKEIGIKYKHRHILRSNHKHFSEY